MLAVNSLDCPRHVMLTARGEIDLANQDAFEEIMLRLLTETSVSVDLSRVDFVSVSALAALVRCHQTAAANGRHFVLLDPPRMVVRLVRLAQLDGELELRFTPRSEAPHPSPRGTLRPLPRPR